MTAAEGVLRSKQRKNIAPYLLQERSPADVYHLRMTKSIAASHNAKDLADIVRSLDGAKAALLDADANIVLARGLVEDHAASAILGSIAYDLEGLARRLEPVRGAFERLMKRRGA